MSACHALRNKEQNSQSRAGAAGERRTPGHVGLSSTVRGGMYVTGSRDSGGGPLHDGPLPRGGRISRGSARLSRRGTRSGAPPPAFLAAGVAVGLAVEAI